MLRNITFKNLAKYVTYIANANKISTHSAYYIMSLTDYASDFNKSTLSMQHVSNFRITNDNTNIISNQSIVFLMM